MAEEGNIISNLRLDGADAGGQAGANGEDTAPIAGIVTQYVKDLSVENPNAPDCFQWQDAPQLDVQFNIQARPLQGEFHEVELKVQITAKAEAGTAYIVELSYAALIGMRNLDEANMHAFTFAEAPRLLFPFARRVIADAVRDAGFAPLMLEPIDFNGLYMAQLAGRGQSGPEAAAQGTPTGNA